MLIDGNTYAAGPVFHGRMLTVGLRHDVVEILDEYSEPVCSFLRAFGQQAETIFDPVSLLPLLVTKPGAWSHSPLRALVTDPVRQWSDRATATDRRRMLNALDAASSAAGFDAAFSAADTLIQCGDEPHMATALVAAACRQGIQARFFTTYALVMMLRRAKEEDRFDKELDSLAKNQVPAIDELGHLSIDTEGARLLFQMTAGERYSAMTTWLRPSLTGWFITGGCFSSVVSRIG